ncbi:MAG: hypothetical protein CH6_0545 [Candidatus Kapaibacterium sp.]|nr:MAG: hypothetical protein CH6_0545 [Candidatus Kapabacteria bacterium]
MVLFQIHGKKQEFIVFKEVGFSFEFLFDNNIMRKQEVAIF